MPKSVRSDTPPTMIERSSGKALGLLTVAGLSVGVSLTLLSPLARAQSTVLQPSSNAPAESSPTGPFWLPPFRYVPGANQYDPDRQEVKRPAAQQRIVDLYTASDYAAAAQEGETLMAREKVDDELRLMIANSLAWTGQISKAEQLYQGVTDPALVGDANVGLASILRWQGKDHLALPIYRSVLEQNPQHKDAREGQDLAERELAPRTTVSLGTLSDSNNFNRLGEVVNHRWRDHEGWRKYELELSGVDDTQNNLAVKRQEGTFRYQMLDTEYKPTFEVSLPSTGNNVFGGVKVLTDKDRLQWDVGRVNWGRMVNNASALDQSLWATHLGVLGRYETLYGNVVGQGDYYTVSDGNFILSGNLRLLSNWQPLGSHIKPYVGVEMRKADFVSSSYWSPSDGYGSAYGGLQGSWDVGDWSFESSGHLGVPVWGEAGNSWSLSAAVRKWVTRNLALGANVWAMSSQRSGVAYNAQSANVVLEKVWR
jgi:hypothetical protein